MKTLSTSLRFMIVMTILTGFLYPAVMTGTSKIFFPERANGSLVKNKDGKITGSELIAQGFKNEKYFWPRPSAVDYNPMPSGGSNFSPTSQDSVAKVKERQAQGLTDESLYASGSGLDPHISPANAYHQVARVAKARGMSEDAIHAIVTTNVEHRQLGFLGEERVNVLKLNLALDQRP